MNKGQGVTVGAILAASLALRPAMEPSPRAMETSIPSSVTKSVLPGTGKGPAREGPWLASCRYWAPVRSVEKGTHQVEAAKDNTPEIKAKLQPKSGEFDFYMDMKGPERDWGCGAEQGARWGLPEDETTQEKEPASALTPKHQPHITAVIATVPDPIHTHLALSFDRAIVAILQGASDNGYVSSTYWMPWARHGAPVHTADSAGEDEAGHDPEREREPGLIVLKYVPSHDQENRDPEKSYYKVIYLFLVAETPSRGVDGFQLSHAFAYEKELEDGLIRGGNRKKPGKATSTPVYRCDALRAAGAYQAEFRRGRGCDVDVIGPLYTGSAASLRVGIDDASSRYGLNRFDVRGGTSSQLAVDQLVEKAVIQPVSTAHEKGKRATGKKPRSNTKRATLPKAMEAAQAKSTGAEINYHSFAGSGRLAEGAFVRRLQLSEFLDLQSPYPRVGSLTEDNTALGNWGAPVDHTEEGDKKQREIPKASPAAPPDPDSPEALLHIASKIEDFRFPREISLLRNAQQDVQAGAGNEGAAPSPYLKLTGKDTGEQDELPQFSRDNTPLMQEAELMMLSRQIQHDRVQYLVMSTPSSPLDQIFLGRFLHRSNPNTRLVFLDSDLLMVREVDSAPFLGSITVSPFPMFDMDDRAYSDVEGVAYYNAASMTFWSKDVVPDIGRSLDSSYRDPLTLAGDYQPALWATAIGTDGYYPLGQLRPCASNRPEILPALDVDGNPEREDCVADPAYSTPLNDPYPVSRLWIGLALVVSLMCVVHSVLLVRARYWSTVTGHLVVLERDEQERRAVYMEIGGVVLFLMAFTVAFPVLALHHMSDTSKSNEAGAVVLVALGLLAVGATLWKTAPGLFRREPDAQGKHGKWMPRKQALLVYMLVGVECAGIAWLWQFLCWNNSSSTSPSYRGLSFSYRCIHPESGVSPLVPVLLLLFSWHLWSLLQTGKLRFSKLGRPSIPGKLYDSARDRYFVSSEALSQDPPGGRRCLFSNITETFVAERLFWWLSPTWPRLAKFLAFGLAVIVPSGVAVFSLFDGVDHFLWNTGPLWSSPYEALIGVLFYPLFVIAVAGWGRMLLVWSSLRRDMLDRLENQPIRFAFNRLKGMGWMALMQQGAVYESWRDMARSIESIRQMLNQEEMTTKHATLAWELSGIQAQTLGLVKRIQPLVVGEKPKPGEKGSHELMAELEEKFGEYGQWLLARLLVPYWAEERTGLVDSDMMEAMPVKARRSETQAEENRLAMDVFAEPEAERKLIAAAEEFIALRYIALIRAVLTSLRYVIAFVSAFFVLTIVAWNSYPFQPRELVDWLTTCLMVVLGAGMIWVFAQMHRNPILSRATDTKSNELGWDFYLRVIAFGALPVVTWLAYSFPEVGGFIYRIVQPGVSVLK